MLDTARFPTFDAALSVEVESSDTFSFEPAAHPETDYATLAAFHGIEPLRLVLIDPHAHTAFPARAAEELAQVADMLASDGWQVAIVGDLHDVGDRNRTSAVLGAMQAGALYLAGATTPETLAALVGDARLVLCEESADSGIARASRACGTPLIYIADGLDDHDDAQALVNGVLAELHAQSTAHPGAPFTLHTPALRDAA
jgi:ADP-heptose:LPS heptosyltransferase